MAQKHRNFPSFHLTQRMSKMKTTEAVSYKRLRSFNRVKSQQFFHYTINMGHVIVKGVVVAGSWIRHNEASTSRIAWKRREVLSGKTLRKIPCYDYDIGCRCIYAIHQPSRSTKDARWIIKFLVSAAGRALWVFLVIL